MTMLTLGGPFKDTKLYQCLIDSIMSNKVDIY